MKHSLVLAMCLATACGGTDDPGPGVFFDAAPRVDAGPLDAAPPDAVSMTDAAPLPDGPTDTLGPIVAVLSPAMNDSDLTATAMVTTAQFTARCEARPNPTTMSPIDSLAVEMTAIVGTRSQSAPARPTPTPHEYHAAFDLTGFPNGVLQVRCTARDTEPVPHVNSDEITNFLDLGPRINVFNPLPSSSYANSVDVLFEAQPWVVQAGDTAAAVSPTTVKMCVAGANIIVAADGGGTYSSIIYFNAEDYVADPDFTTPLPNCAGTGLMPQPAWSPPLEGATSALFSATNSRGVTRTVRVDYIADSKGPIVTITSPAAGELVGGFMTVTANVSDPAGVSQVTGTIAHFWEFPMSGSGASYSGTFDTRQLPHFFVYPLLEVRARDLVGNERAAGMIVTLDNTAPLLSLDPPHLREAIAEKGPRCLSALSNQRAECDACLATDACTNTWLSPACTGDPAGSDCQDLMDSPQGDTCETCLKPHGCHKCAECSRTFDPVGDDAISDGQLVRQLSEPRLRVEDHGNAPTFLPDDIDTKVAGVAAPSVQLFIYDHVYDDDGNPGTFPVQPLLVDLDPTDADPYCNALNPALIPAVVPMLDNEMAVINLAALEPAGASRNNDASSFQAYGSDPLIDDAMCIDHDVPTTPDPGDLCLSAEGYTRIIASETGGAAAIYAIPPLPPLTCMGNAFDSAASNMRDGWACMVAIAEDQLGNFNLSPPLRVCFDWNEDGLDSDGNPLASSGCPTAFGATAPEANRPSCTDGCIPPLSFEDFPEHQLQMFFGTTQCSDGLDNDGDGAIDLDDPGCLNSDDNSE